MGRSGTRATLSLQLCKEYGGFEYYNDGNGFRSFFIFIIV